MSLRIEHLWAFISPDNENGDEGLVAIKLGRTWVPLVSADEALLKLLLPIVQDLVAGPKRVQLVRFDARVDLETIGTRRPS